MRKRGVEWTIIGGRREGIPYYIIYREGDPPRPSLGGREGEGERRTINTRQYGWAFAPTEDEGVTILRTRA